MYSRAAPWQNFLENTIPAKNEKKSISTLPVCNSVPKYLKMKTIIVLLSFISFVSKVIIEDPAQRSDQNIFAFNNLITSSY